VTTIRNITGVPSFRHMNEDQVHSILTRIPWAGQIGRSGDWHLKTCCLMGHRHTRGVDRSPSMTVSFDVPIPWIECFACGYKKPLERALYELVAESRLDPEVAILFTDYKRGALTLEPLTKKLRTVDYSIPLAHVRKNEFPSNVVLFLRTKGITKRSTVDLFQLAYMPAGHSDEWLGEDSSGNPRVMRMEGIVLPVLVPHEGGLMCVGAQLRYIEGEFRYYAVYPFPSQSRLFGEHLLPACKGKHLFLTEGPFDAMHIVEEGHNAVAIMGTAMHDEKALTISAAGPEMVHILLDNDAAGEKARPKIESILKKYGIPFCSHKATKDPKQYTRSEFDQFTKNNLIL